MGFLVACLTFGIVYWFLNRHDCIDEQLLTVISFSIAGLMLISIPISRIGVQDFIAERDALQATYNDLRDHPLEMATIASKIADYNASLASYQYWYHTQWKWWIPGDINQTKPIR